jgi:uncharacterized protein
MTVIGAVSDTHLPRFGRHLPAQLVDALRAARVDGILHAGDLTAPFVLDLLGEVAPVVAVAGNNDPPEVHEEWGDRRILEIEAIRMGLTHGHVGKGRTTPERARRLFAGDSVDLVVFGHSHQPLWVPATEGMPALLNPGSPTDRRREPAYSFALLEVQGSRVEAEIVRFGDRTRSSRPRDSRKPPGRS